jgi:hypothetical protein
LICVLAFFSVALCYWAMLEIEMCVHLYDWVVGI